LNEEMDISNLEKGKLKIRENHTKYFKNEEFWTLLRKSLSINVNGHINKSNEALHLINDQLYLYAHKPQLKYYQDV